MKLVIFICVCFILLPTCRFPGKRASVNKADVDTVFKNGSGISAISLDSNKIRMLTDLGMVWGYLKYYHANVNKGDFNMDAELFRILPDILAAKDKFESDKILERWINHFGVPDTCKHCRENRKSQFTKLLPEVSYLFDTSNFPKSLTEKLTFLFKNRYESQEHYYVQPVPSIGNVVFKHESPYESNVCPDAGLRLLSLFRFWNMVEYFYPDRHFIGADWKTALTKFIPVFCSVESTGEYQMAILQLLASVHDTHTNIWYGRTPLDDSIGYYVCPFQAAFVEKKLVVVGYNFDLFSLRDTIFSGDVIEKVNGVEVDSLVKKYLPFTPASNYTTQLRDLSGINGFLLRGREPDISLQILRAGKSVKLKLKRREYHGQSAPSANNTTSFKVLDGDIGYIYPGNLHSNDFEKISTQFMETKGIIIDLRCYPAVFMPYTFGAWLKPAPTPFAVISRASVDLPGFFEICDTLVNGGSPVHYNGKLVIIVNEQTVSQAEFTTMALSTVPGAMVIGSTTAGADGDVVSVTLPGGVSTGFSGIGIYYPDGTETQRVGVKIDKIVTPTIKGIREGRDELLDAAIQLINEK